MPSSYLYNVCAQTLYLCVPACPGPYSAHSRSLNLPDRPACINLMYCAVLQKPILIKASLSVIIYSENTLYFSSSYVLQELVETERDYVRDLGCVVEVCIFGNLRA